MKRKRIRYKPRKKYFEIDPLKQIESQIENIKFDLINNFPDSSQLKKELFQLKEKRKKLNIKKEVDNINLKINEIEEQILNESEDTILKQKLKSLLEQKDNYVKERKSIKIKCKCCHNVFFERIGKFDFKIEYVECSKCGTINWTKNLILGRGWKNSLKRQIENQKKKDEKENMNKILEILDKKTKSISEQLRGEKIKYV